MGSASRLSDILSQIISTNRSNTAFTLMFSFADVSKNSRPINRKIWLIEWCFTLPSTLLQSYDTDSSHIHVFPASTKVFSQNYIHIHDIELLILSQTSPGFYVSAVQVFWKQWGKRSNCLCFLQVWRPFCHFHQIWNNCLKLFQFGVVHNTVIWERVNSWPNNQSSR